MQNQINFRGFNETDVREEILAPLIRKLGYRSGSKDNVIREQLLRYPHVFIGQKNFNKDPILRGKADYILEAGSTVRWVIEAKAPDVEIDKDTVEQAYTYANHPEVRAVYFSICNGKRLVVFQTNKSPTSKPVLNLVYEEFEKNYQAIANLLCPASILRDHPDIEADFGEPLGKGLRSLVRIANGVISYHECSVNLPAIKEIQTVIYGGSVERDTEKGLIAYLKTIAPTKSLEKLNQRLGISAFEMHSDSMYLSSDPANPTVFRGAQTVTLSAGERILDINSWREVTLPMNITCRVSTQASGHLQNNRFYGDFISEMDYKTMNQQIRLKGEYEIFIA